MARADLVCEAEEAFKVEALGDRALLVILGEGIDGQVNDRVHQLAGLLRQRALTGIRDLVPAYATLAVHYDPAAFLSESAPPHAVLEQELRRLWQGGGARAVSAPRQVEIPVCYGGPFGPDLSDVAAHCGLSEPEVVARHAAAEYRVFMLGFAPGFPYLGGLDPSLAAPRRAAPRARVAAGSVGIAGRQTGIYSLDTPGGWQIIGRTPRRLFEPAGADPCLVRPGDRLRFKAIDEATFRHLQGPSA